MRREGRESYSAHRYLLTTVAISTVIYVGMDRRGGGEREMRGTPRLLEIAAAATALLRLRAACATGGEREL